MDTTAKATYFATDDGGNFTYVLLLRNTSSNPYDIYAALLGAQYNVPILPGGAPQNMVSVSAPGGWQFNPFSPPYGGGGWGTNFTGNASSSGYIMPDDVGTFVFQSSTPPPKSLPFGCCFYNGDNEWGFAFDGTAELVHCIPLSEFPRSWNRPRTSQPHPQSPIRSLPVGITSRTIQLEDAGPAITVSWDRFSNVIKLTTSR